MERWIIKCLWSLHGTGSGVIGGWEVMVIVSINQALSSSPQSNGSQCRSQGKGFFPTVVSSQYVIIAQLNTRALELNRSTFKSWSYHLLALQYYIDYCALFTSI